MRSITGVFKAMTLNRNTSAAAPAPAPCTATRTQPEHPGEKTQMTPAETQRIATEVLRAFDELTHQRGDLVLSFQEAFNDRAKVPGLSESRGSVNGLTDVLSGLLRRLPPSTHISSRLSSRTFEDGAFKKRFEVALSDVADEYPRTLILMERHQRDSGLPLPKFLAELLQLYVDDRAAISY